MSENLHPMPGFFLAAEAYMARLGGKRGWLDVHINNRTPTGFRLLMALDVCEQKVSGLGVRLAIELAEVKYTSADDSPEKWYAGFEQLIQKIAEILVAQQICLIDWPEGTVIQCEPKNNKTDARPDFSAETPDRIYLFEVKCPTFVKHHKQRDQGGIQIPVRSFIKDAFPGSNSIVTLPRDNTIKDFLESADKKFRDFSEKPVFAILAIVWDSHMYEATAVLSHPESGLLTEKSWYTKNGIRVSFDAVDGVIVINRLDEIKSALQNQYDCSMHDPFSFGGSNTLPNTWCPNIGASSLEPFLAKAFDAWDIDGAQLGAEYGMLDYVWWVDAPGSPKNVRRVKRQKFLRGLGNSTSLSS